MDLQVCHPSVHLDHPGFQPNGVPGFEVETVYGDFMRGELQDNSEEMIWVAKRSRE